MPRKKVPPPPDPAPTEEEPPKHPLVAEIDALGKEFDKLGVPWGFGARENLMELRPAVLAETAVTLLLQSGLVTAAQVDDVMLTILRDKMAAALALVREAAKKQPGIFVPDPSTPLPPGLLRR